ncbi:MAG: aldo/keto reductase, partial [Chloroflexi bacterium]|nr:aldo/keto reductase [Chloroflexota bacterium]
MAHDETRKFNRRDLLSVGGAAAAGAALAGCAHAVAPQATTPAQSAPVPAASPPAVTEGKGVQRFRTLGRTGFKVSDIGMGCSRMSEANVVRYAYDKGVNFFDCAETYSNGESERQIGEAMAHMDRAKIFLTTKLRLNPDDSEAAIRERVGKCLERMKTSYVDGLYLHSPPTVAAVKHEAFHKAGAQLKAEGKVRHLGLSSHGPRGKGGDSMEQVLLSAVADGRFDVMLLVYNFLNHKEGDVVLKACREKNIGTACMKASPGVLMVSAFDPDNPSEEHAALLKQFMAGAGSREKAIDKVRRSLKADEKKMAKDRPLLEPIANRYGLKTQEDVN